jgi:hypothetical protein
MLLNSKTEKGGASTTNCSPSMDIFMESRKRANDDGFSNASRMRDERLAPSSFATTR